MTILPSNLALQLPGNLTSPRNQAELKADRFYPREVAWHVPPKAGVDNSQRVIAELQKFLAETEVDIYVGKCCDVHFQPSDCDGPALVLVDETQQV